MIEKRILETALKIPKHTIIEKFCKLFCGVFSVPLGFTTVKTNNMDIIMRYGKYDGFRNSGIRWVPIGSINSGVFLGDRISVQNDMFITDLRGNPIIVRSSVTYRVNNPLNYILNVNNDKIIELFFESHIRKKLCNFTYDDILKCPILISNDLPKLEEYGVEIKHSDILDIKYSPEIAKSMLIKQQVMASIDARKYMVDNIMEITNEIKLKNPDLTREDTSKLVTYLIVSMLTDKTPQLTYNISD